MAKKRERSEVEFLRGENRKLKARIRQLERRVKQNEKYDFELENDLLEQVIKESCDECGKGTFRVIDLKYSKFEVCDICQKRRKLA